MFSSPQESRRANRRSSDAGAACPRPRSHSLNSADTRWQHHRTVKFLISDSEDEDGYGDNEGSSAESARRPIKSRERPRSAAPKDPLSRVKDMHAGPSTHHCRPGSSHSLRGTSPSGHDRRQPLQALEQHRSQQASPLPQGPKNSKKRLRSLGSAGRRLSQNTPPAAPSPSRLQQKRPSSAGPVVKNRRQKVIFLKKILSQCLWEQYLSYLHLFSTYFFFITFFFLLVCSALVIRPWAPLAALVGFSLTPYQSCCRHSARKRGSYLKPSQRRATLYAQPFWLCKRPAITAQRR